MFAVLQPLPLETGIKARLRKRFHPPQPELRAVRVPAGLGFYELDVPQGAGGIPWQSVCEAGGTLARKLLLPEGLRLPPDSGCEVLQCNRYQPRLLFNSALRLIRTCALEPRNTQITVLDRGAHFAADIRALLPHAATVRVITSLPGRYTHAVRAILEEFGATVLLCEDVEAAMGSTFILALDHRTDFFAGDAALLSSAAQPIRARCRFSVTAGGATLPAAYQALLPPGVAPERFAEALYEHCCVAPLGGLCYAQYFLHGAPSSPAELAQEIRAYFG